MELGLRYLFLFGLLIVSLVLEMALYSWPSFSWDNAISIGRYSNWKFGGKFVFVICISYFVCMMSLCFYLMLYVHEKGSSVSSAFIHLKFWSNFKCFNPTGVAIMRGLCWGGEPSDNDYAIDRMTIKIGFLLCNLSLQSLQSHIHKSLKLRATFQLEVHVSDVKR